MEIDFKKDIEDFDLIFLDIETTGLKVADEDRICEVAAVKVKERKIIDKFHTLINPQKDIPYEAFKIHKLTDDDVKMAPTFEEIASKFVDFIKGGVICAYNAEFDIGFINHQLKIAFYSEVNVPIIDILAMAKKTIKLDSYKLINVANFFNINFERLHRALDDAKVSAEVFFRLVDILKKQNLTVLEQYLSIFGVSNLYNKQKEEKIAALKEAILKKINLAIDFFSYNNNLQKDIIRPVSLLEENKKVYLWYEGKDKKLERINIDRIFKIHLI